MNKAKILIIEDDLCLGEALEDTLALAGYAPMLVQSIDAAINSMTSFAVDLVVVKMQLLTMSNINFLKFMRDEYVGLPIILMASYGEIPDVSKYIHQGASDYIIAPFEAEMLMSKVGGLLPKISSDTIEPIAEDPHSKQILALARKVAQTDATVLISGNSGTGKEVLARYVHLHSKRAMKPFVAINCAAIPENMLEATLFGFEKNIYHGAPKTHPGKLEQAQRGTILLDEIAEMNLNVQAKLLRVLQEKEFERLGGKEIIDLNVRIIATTNHDLRADVDNGVFREDLFYRLNVFPLRWTPLVERSQDIMPLAEYMLSKYAQADHRPIPSLSENAKEKLLRYSWPGNAREMENVMQRALILQAKEEISEADILLEDMSMFQQESAGI